MSEADDKVSARINEQLTEPISSIPENNNAESIYVVDVRHLSQYLNLLSNLLGMHSQRSVKPYDSKGFRSKIRRRFHDSYSIWISQI